MGTIVSPMIAVFGLHTLARLTAEKLWKYKFMRIFRVIDYAFLVYSAQNAVVFQTIFVRFSIVECEPLLLPADSAKFLCNFVVICEMLGFSMLVSFLAHPRKSALFDTFKRKDEIKSEMTLKTPATPGRPLAGPVLEPVAERNVPINLEKLAGSVLKDEMPPICEWSDDETKCLLLEL
uniref:Serpentine receptor class gamma n=1 Tax=Steinernema glaseri TaxID=37863 RepID=A0A1I7Z1F4_9BILA